MTTLDLKQHQHHVEGIAMASAKAAPPVAVSVMSIAGISLQEWVLALTAAYTFLLILHTTLKIWVQYKQLTDLLQSRPLQRKSGESIDGNIDNTDR